MNSQRLAYFVHAAETLNFTRTAEAFYISQTAISIQMKELEQELGVKLFVRDRRTLRLTKAGELFVVEARNLLAAEEASVRRVRQAAEAQDAQLCIGLMPDLVDLPMMQAVKNVHGMHPYLLLSFRSAADADLLAMVRSGEIDAAITRRADASDFGDLAYRKIHRYRIGAVLPRTSPLADRAEIERDELQGERLIEFRFGPSDTSGIQDRADRPDTGGLFAPDVACLHAMMAAGMGGCVLPASHGIQLAHDLGMAFVPLRGEWCAQRLVVVWDARNPGKGLRAFLESLEELGPTDDVRPAR